MPLDPLTHPDADALRACIAADPASDVPRLAYAEWLTEHGSDVWRARAEFIRLQIDAARHAPSPDKVLMPLTAERLLFNYYAAWWQELPAWLRTDEQRSTPAPTQGYRRGFVGQFLRSGEWWAKGVGHPPRVPVDQLEVWFRKGKGDPLTVGMVPQLASVSKLIVCFDTLSIGAVVAALGASPHAGRVRHLTLWGPAGPDTAPKLATAGGLTAVGHLCLKVTGANPMQAGPLTDLLADGSALPHLKGVELTGVGSTAELIALVQSPGFRRVETLALAGKDVTDAVLTALADSPHAAGLRSLGFKQTRLTDAGVMALADAPALGGLTALDLQGSVGWFGRAPVPIGKLARQRLRARFPFALLDS